MEDFMMAFEEVKPAFGAVRDTLESYRLNGIINYGESFQHLSNTCNSLVEQARRPTDLRRSERWPIDGQEDDRVACTKRDCHLQKVLLLPQLMAARRPMQPDSPQFFQALPSASRHLHDVI